MVMKWALGLIVGWIIASYVGCQQTIIHLLDGCLSWHTQYSWLVLSLSSTVRERSMAPWRWKTIQNAAGTKGKVKTIFARRLSLSLPALFEEAKTILLDCTFVHVFKFIYFLFMTCKFPRLGQRDHSFFCSVFAITISALRANGSHYLISKTFSGNLYTNWFRSCRDRDRDATH